ncbi:hypothetical protein [Desulfosporosinus metallidurans]|uniref:Uncharacterized protein n=1 Tax=Desulfosporosinus metallidurans TaxID=1888891 RepID=A0A1Q8R1V9_9FIRM|nr:hypothetical protein [Desulfosporosinus metallidurans]OLN33582.1 hypothetical protein DSOL_0292 [Desulfosporosinus metallidurans]
MVIKRRQIDRERLAGALIFISLFIILMSMVSIRFLDVKVTNIELVDNDLYTIVTDKGPVNINTNDILRIERTYAKAAITGTPVEMDRIFTTKGFIYFSSLDPFYKIGHQLINSVDFVGKSVWINSKTSDATQTEWTSNQRQTANLKLIQPFNYAMGTPSNLTSVIFFVVSLQYLALAVGGTALFVLIFPLRLDTSMPAHSFLQQDPEIRSEEEKFGVVAK